MSLTKEDLNAIEALLDKKTWNTGKRCQHIKI
jgi:hypothetical protein